MNFPVGVATVTEETLFAAALEKGTRAERAAFLEEACAGDAGLRRRVEALLGSHEDTEFMNIPAVERAAKPFAGEETAAMAGPTEGAEPGAPLDFLTPPEKPGLLGRLDHYEILEVIGRGGMGVVLRGFDEKLHRVVAIKVMAAQLATSAAARRRFTREAQAAAAVSHDHIVTIHAVEESDGLPYLVMQYVPGKSLQDRLEGDGPLKLTEILRIGMQSASGLAAAHAQGLIHRDIKPANILLENGVDRVKITDFGLARAADDASLTQSGVVAGTPQYMAPEQARGEAVDRRADLFSLGSVLYAMCTGRAPFRANGTMAVLKRVCEATPSPIRESNPEIPNWLVAIIEKLHAKDPAGRYQSAAEVAEILGQRLVQVQHPSVVPLPRTLFLERDRQVRPPLVGKLGRAGVIRRCLAAAAVGFLCLVAGLGLSEATGVTRLAATVIRILTPDGTLVIEASDPSVSVTIEGDGGLVITGAGAREVRLQPGSYRLHATKDGKSVRLDRDLVTITRNDKQVVRVRLDAGAAIPAVALPGSGAFVLVGSEGVPDRTFDVLADAVVNSTHGDTIEVRGNGPFVFGPLEFWHALTIRAGPGFSPVLIAAPQVVLPHGDLWLADHDLCLEGLRIRCTRTAQRILRVAGTAGRLHVANCRFELMTPGISVECEGSCDIRNSELISSAGPALAIRCVSDSTSNVANCIVVGLLSLEEYDITRAAMVQITGNTFLAQDNSAILHAIRPVASPHTVFTGATVKQIHVITRNNIFESPHGIYSLTQSPRLEPRFDADDSERWIPRRVKWTESQNLYGVCKPYLRSQVYQTGEIPLKRGGDFSDWNRFWGLTGTGSLEGVIRFHGGDLAGRAEAKAAKLTPQDFRLRADSAGYRTGPGGKDLGADVDIVGPGAAYERWKKSPEYQQWLKETGQAK